MHIKICLHTVHLVHSYSAKISTTNTNRQYVRIITMPDIG